MKATCAYVGLDVHKETIAVAVADAGRDGEVRFWGTVPNTAHHVQKLAEKLDERHGHVEFMRSTDCSSPAAWRAR
jgi:transposase